MILLWVDLLGNFLGASPHNVSNYLSFPGFSASLAAYLSRGNMGPGVMAASVRFLVDKIMAVASFDNPAATLAEVVDTWPEPVGVASRQGGIGL